MSNARKKKRYGGGDKRLYYIAAAIVVVIVIAIIIAISLSKKPKVKKETYTPSTVSSSENSSALSESSSEQSSDSVESSQSESFSVDSKAEEKTDNSTAESSEESGKVSSSNEVYTANGDWRLQIASVAHPLPDNFVQPSTTVIDSDGREIDSRIYSDYKNLVGAAAEDGIKIYPISAFRPHSTQVSLFNRRVEQARQEGYSDPKAEAARHVAVPGTSEHELGLAVDFNSVDEQTFRNTAEAKWLAEHCTEYGFVIRYPEDKESVTGIIYEPWHLRYVGVENAKRMKELNMCLEEYVDRLNSGNS